MNIKFLIYVLKICVICPVCMFLYACDDTYDVVLCNEMGIIMLLIKRNNLYSDTRMFEKNGEKGAFLICPLHFGFTFCTDPVFFEEPYPDKKTSKLPEHLLSYLF